MTERPVPGTTSPPVPELDDEPRHRGPALLLVRHGETTSNVRGALDTALPGAPLTALGREQAVALGRELRAEGLAPERLLSSEALRARETAALVGAELGTDPHAVPGVYEVQAGDLEMRADPAAIGSYDALLHAWLARGEYAEALPGGETAEDVRARITPVLDELGAVVRSGGDCVLVVHGTLLRLAAVFLGAVPPAWALVNRIPNCGIVELAPTTGGGWECARWGHARGPLTF